LSDSLESGAGLIPPEVAEVSSGAEPFAVFEKQLKTLVASCQHPVERRIRYGNLRTEVSENNSDGKVTKNAAIVYETPGGSTTQINVTYEGGAGTFSYLSEDLRHTVRCQSPRQVIDMVTRHAQRIPAKRMDALLAQIDSWLEEGKTRREMFGEMNKLLQAEFLGGRISNEELKAGIQHIVREHQKSRA